MKRLASILVLIITLCSCIGALSEKDEITLLGIPWLSDDIIAIETLFNKGYIRSDNDVQFSRDTCVYLTVDDSEVPQLSLKSQDACCVSVRLDSIIKGKIGGYALSDLALTFAYDGTYHLIFASVDFINADYDDIKQKLTKVYGESEKYDKMGDIVNVWKGSNHSSVILFGYSDGMGFDLCYGRLDAEEILQNCIMIPAPDDVSGL